MLSQQLTKTCERCEKPAVQGDTKCWRHRYRAAREQHRKEEKAAREKMLDEAVAATEARKAAAAAAAAAAPVPGLAAAPPALFTGPGHAAAAALLLRRATCAPAAHGPDGLFVPELLRRGTHTGECGPPFKSSLCHFIHA
jgi:hypothetical protein